MFLTPPRMHCHRHWDIDLLKGAEDTLPETNIAPENGWLELEYCNTTFLLGWPIFRGHVSFREGIQVVVTRRIITITICFVGDSFYLQMLTIPGKGEGQPYQLRTYQKPYNLL